jgi:hypothetical protein
VRLADPEAGRKVLRSTPGHQLLSLRNAGSLKDENPRWQATAYCKGTRTYSGLKVRR